MPILLLDDNGKPIPQYKNAAGTAFEAVRGKNGGMDVNVLEAPAIAAGTNLIGKIQPVDANSYPFGLATIYKYAGYCDTEDDTILWTPASGKRIVLKGIRLQNQTVVEHSVAEGLSENDYAYVDIQEDYHVIVSFYLAHRVIISEIDPYGESHFLDTGYHQEVINFGEGLILGVDQPLTIYSDTTDVSVNAWGYEV